MAKNSRQWKQEPRVRNMWTKRNTSSGKFMMRERKPMATKKVSHDGRSEWVMVDWRWRDGRKVRGAVQLHWVYREMRMGTWRGTGRMAKAKAWARALVFLCSKTSGAKMRAVDSIKRLGLEPPEARDWYGWGGR